MMTVKTGKKPAASVNLTAAVRVGQVRTLARLGNEAKVIRDSLNRMLGVIDGRSADEPAEAHDHRVRSVTGRVRTLLKGMARLREGLDDLEGRLDQ